MSTEETRFAIMGCLVAFQRGYSEAQHAGIDSHSAYECAIEEVRELLEVNCNCDYTPPYGFVPEAGCPIHDAYPK